MAQVLGKEQLKGQGTGWVEHWLPSDDESTQKTVIFKCAFVNNYITDETGFTTRPKAVEDWYGKVYGVRVWDKEPTEKERFSIAWLA